MKPIPDDPNFVTRFNAHVDRSGGDAACWDFLLATGEDGYGTWTWTGPNGERWKYRAHRLALTLAEPPPRDGMYALHQCNNRMCYNPNPRPPLLGDRRRQRSRPRPPLQTLATPKPQDPQRRPARTL